MTGRLNRDKPADCLEVRSDCTDIQRCFRLAASIRNTLLHVRVVTYDLAGALHFRLICESFRWRDMGLTGLGLLDIISCILACTRITCACERVYDHLRYQVYLMLIRCGFDMCWARCAWFVTSCGRATVHMLNELPPSPDIATTQ